MGEGHEITTIKLGEGHENQGVTFGEGHENVGRGGSLNRTPHGGEGHEIEPGNYASIRDPPSSN